MKSMMRRSTLREVRQSFGRFFAILAIVALGVGFFAGLKVSQTAIVKTADEYLKEKQLFDYRLLSTLGFEEEDVETAAAQEGVRSVQAGITYDGLFLDPEGTESVLKAHSLPEAVNGLELEAGRMPQQPDECVVDSNFYGQGQIGEKVFLSENNKDEDKEVFRYREYTVTGIVRSSYYINFERGSSSLGNGKVSGYLYIPMDGFDSEYYTEIFVKFDQDEPIYSDAYDRYIEAKDEEWEELCAAMSERRYQSILSEAQEKLSDAEQELADKRAEGEAELSDAEQELLDAEEEIADGEKSIEKAEKEIADKKAELDRADSEIEAGRQELLAQQSQMEALAAYDPQQYEAAMAQAQAASAQLDEAKRTADSGRRQLETAEREIRSKKTELTDAKQEVEDGWQEYKEALQEFQDKIREAEEELEEAREEIADIEEPDSFVLGRETNIGYACFENDSRIIEGIVGVFPVFFFLVAALVCMTTMNRMVEEQRTQIGILKALGYGEFSIMTKYLFYSGCAAVIGSVGGFIGGTLLFPEVIWNAYGMMYNMGDLIYVFDINLALISLVVALICSMGTTWISCRYELVQTAADLMRPKAPKAGKRVFLEYVPVLWKRLKFLHKVSIRNVVRYKKRFFMMVIGISGCTALLVTGLGIKDSIAGVAERQFEKVQIFDLSVNFKAAQEPGQDTEFIRTVREESGNSLLVAQKSVDLLWEGRTKVLNLVTLPQGEDTDPFVNLHTVSGAPIGQPQDGEAVLTNKMAETFGIKAGDVIVLRDEDLKELKVTVSAVAENFVDNYVYLNAATYQEQAGEKPEYNTAYVKLREGHDPYQAAADLMRLGDVTAVTVNAATMDRIGSMMKSLDYIVLLVIGCAAFLAFIVLYNLTNINITERIREIATIKVLGFYKRETSAYVFRENLFLTGAGCAVGLALGFYLHRFVMSQIKVDLVAFDTHIAPLSYGLSILLTFAFAWFVNLVMSVKIERINMAESLKSVD